MKPSETRLLPGLPQGMALSYSDLKRRAQPPSRFPKSGPRGPGRPPSRMNFGLPGPGQPLRWLEEVEENYWKSVRSDSFLFDERSNHESNYREDEVVQWLIQSQVSQSVIYVSFGSEVGPTLEEYAESVAALGELNHSFIWVFQPGSRRPGDDFSEMVKKDDIMQQIENLMGGTIGLGYIFGNGCPSTSMASLKAFLDPITQ
ncbi:Hypothetical predicted protein [Olea europaea subsp. europaea]|uniref:Uncharacterized protein n=1 Tax=Olea europaea subsp. europaea TaxID=158383 RepID=A0A8S0UN63_OLEEU|nr:Hypothetical predicted protein [Olea europaea subsp. europaea]